MTDRESELGPEGEPLQADGGEEELTLEARLRRLERIVAALEGGEIELDKGLALFEEGIAHVRVAEALLARAELKIEELVGRADDLETRPFEGSDD